MEDFWQYFLGGYTMILWGLWLFPLHVISIVVVPGIIGYLIGKR